MAAVDVKALCPPSVSAGPWLASVVPFALAAVESGNVVVVVAACAGSVPVAMVAVIRS